MRPKDKKRLKPKFETIKTVLYMKDLSSREHYYVKGEAPQRVLKEINLRINKSESWGLYAPSPFEIKLLLEIMANINPYHDGRCVLFEWGMMQKKRVILDHVFYIGNSTMPYDNMNVLEFLMFVTARQKDKPVYRQEEIFERLINLTLGHISLTPIKLLTKEEKAIITLLVAAYSDSVMIVFNLPEYKFNEVLSYAIERISSLIVKNKKTLIIGTTDNLLIEKACSHTAYMRDGRIIYKGTVKNLCQCYDNILLTIEDKNIIQFKDWLKILLPNCELEIVGDQLLILDTHENKSNPLEIYKKIVEIGIVPETIKINPKTVQNAYREIDRRYDLQKQLFQ